MFFDLTKYGVCALSLCALLIAMPAKAEEEPQADIQIFWNQSEAVDDGGDIFTPESNLPITDTDVFIPGPINIEIEYHQSEEHSNIVEQRDEGTITQPLPVVLRHVYMTHPALRAAESNVKSTTESIAQALSNYRPHADVSALATVQRTRPDAFGAPSSSQQSLGLNLTQPLYRGGRTTAAVTAADHRIKAARAEFDSAVQTVFLDVVRAYLNLLRDQEILALRVNNESVLKTQMEAVDARFTLGDVTLTDVSQARSRLSAATAERVAASAALRSSQAFFERVTGMDSSGLVVPTGVYLKTEALEPLVETALVGHPDLRAIAAYEKVARSEGREVLGQLLPELALTGSMARDYNPTFGDVDYMDHSRLTLQASMPLYLGGAARSQYRQAQHQARQLDYETRDLERNIRQFVIESWENLQAARASVEAREAQVEAAELAFEGVSEESRYGARTVLDVLDAEQERLNAGVDLISAEFEVISAQYQLLAATGQLTPGLFDIEDITAHFEDHYSKTRRNWFGLGIEE